MYIQEERPPHRDSSATPWSASLPVEWHCGRPQYWCCTHPSRPSSAQHSLPASRPCLFPQTFLFRPEGELASSQCTLDVFDAVTQDPLGFAELDLRGAVQGQEHEAWVEVGPSLEALTLSQGGRPPSTTVPLVGPIDRAVGGVAGTQRAVAPGLAPTAHPPRIGRTLTDHNHWRDGITFPIA